MRQPPVYLLHPGVHAVGVLIGDAVVVCDLGKIFYIWKQQFLSRNYFFHGKVDSLTSVATDTVFVSRILQKNNNNQIYLTVGWLIPPGCDFNFFKLDFFKFSVSTLSLELLQLPVDV